MASAYQLIDHPRADGVRRMADGAFIPHDENSRDWHAYQDWVTAGNTPDPDPNPRVEPAQTVLQASPEGQAIVLTERIEALEARIAALEARLQHGGTA